MPQLSVRMFGKLSVRLNEKLIPGFEASKLRELFCYLLLNRQTPHSRESLASLLWGDNSTAQSKKYLRQTLWELQSILNAHDPEPDHNSILLVDSEWVHLNPAADVWIDVADFEQTSTLARGVAGSSLDARKAAVLDNAVQLYQGDLMEGCYLDWCLCERERLQSLFLIILDKLMSYCEAHQEYEAGLAYGQRAISYERARECTHWRLMRLYYLAGDRTAALRQYARCVDALTEELGVKPTRRTVALYEQIRAGEVDLMKAPVGAAGNSNPDPNPDPPTEVMDRLEQLRAALTDIQYQVQQNLQSVDRILKDRR